MRFFEPACVTVLCILSFVSTPISAIAEPCRGVVFSTFNDADFDKLTDMNVNLVSHDLIWDDSTAADSSTPTTYAAWLNEELVFLDTVIPKLKARGISVVVKLHTPPGGFAVRSGPVTHRIFTEAVMQQALITSWQTIATRYKDESAVYAYDLVNEPAQFYDTVPTGIKDWNALAADVITAVRMIDSVKPIVVGPRFGEAARYNKLVKFNDDNLIYTFHFYHPFKYTHQGIGNGVYKPKKYPNKKLTRKKLKKNMSQAIKFKKKHNVPMFVGEFAVTRWAPGGEKYLKHVINMFEKQNICWTYNSFGTVDVWSFEYTNDRDNPNKSPTMTEREYLLRTYFAKNQ